MWLYSCVFVEAVTRHQDREQQTLVVSSGPIPAGLVGLEPAGWPWGLSVAPRSSMVLSDEVALWPGLIETNVRGISRYHLNSGTKKDIIQNQSHSPSLRHGASLPAASCSPSLASVSPSPNLGTIHSRIYTCLPTTRDPGQSSPFHHCCYQQLLP